MAAEITALKEAGDRHFRNQLFDLAVSSYTKALQTSEQSSTSSLLHVIYSNRFVCKGICAHLFHLLQLHLCAGPPWTTCTSVALQASARTALTQRCKQQ
jgi:hypothetical protein